MLVLGLLISFLKIEIVVLTIAPVSLLYKSLVLCEFIHFKCFQQQKYSYVIFHIKYFVTTRDLCVKIRKKYQRRMLVTYFGDGRLLWLSLTEFKYFWFLQLIMHSISHVSHGQTWSLRKTVGQLKKINRALKACSTKV